MTRVRRGYVDGPHGQMHYLCAGEGMAQTPLLCIHMKQTPLLCIHMSPMTGRSFARLAGEMGWTRPVIAFDTPGYGQSEAPAVPPTIPDYAAALLAGMKALGHARFDVFGYHTGSMTAVAMADLAPARVRRIVMGSAPLFTDAERAALAAHFRDRAPGEDGAHILRRWQFLHHHYDRPGVSLADIHDAFADALSGGRNDGWGHDAAFAYGLAPAMRRVGAETLILNLGDDLWDQTCRAADMPANYRTLDAPGWGHGFLDNYTADVAALVGAFLDGEAVAAPPSALGPRYPAVS